MKYDTPFADRFKTLRENIPATQGEMAEKLGISQQSISFYENGERLPDYEILRRICQVTGCSIRYLFGYQDTWNDTTSIIESNRVSCKIVEPALSNILNINGPDAEVMNLLFRDESPFWNLLYKLGVLASGEAEREIENSCFPSGFFDFLCHKDLDTIITDIKKYGHDIIPEAERKYLEALKKKITHEAAHKQQKIDNDHDECMIKTRLLFNDRIAFEEKKRLASADKFEQFRHKMQSINKEE